MYINILCCVVQGVSLQNVIISNVLDIVLVFQVPLSKLAFDFAESSRCLLSRSAQIEKKIRGTLSIIYITFSILGMCDGGKHLLFFIHFSFEFFKKAVSPSFLDFRCGFARYRET